MNQRRIKRSTLKLGQKMMFLTLLYIYFALRLAVKKKYWRIYLTYVICKSHTVAKNRHRDATVRKSRLRMPYFYPYDQMPHSSLLKRYKSVCSRRTFFFRQLFPVKKVNFFIKKFIQIVDYLMSNYVN